MYREEREFIKEVRLNLQGKEGRERGKKRNTERNMNKGRNNELIEEKKAHDRRLERTEH